MEKEYLKKLKIANIEKGDVVIMFLKIPLSRDASDRIIKNMKEIFPDNKCLILEEGLKLKIIRKNKCGHLKEKIEHL